MNVIQALPTPALTLACSAAVGVAAQFLYSSSPTASDPLPPEFNVEQVQKDPLLLHLFVQLYRHVHVDHERWLDALENADRLLHRYQFLSGGDAEPEANDRIEAFLYMKAAERSLETFFLAAKEVLPAKEAVVVYNVYTRVRSRLQEYFKKIMWLTRG